MYENVSVFRTMSIGVIVSAAIIAASATPALGQSIAVPPAIQGRLNAQGRQHMQAFIETLNQNIGEMVQVYTTYRTAEYREFEPAVAAQQNAYTQWQHSASTATSAINIASREVEEWLSSPASKDAVLAYFDELRDEVRRAYSLWYVIDSTIRMQGYCGVVKKYADRSGSLLAVWRRELRVIEDAVRQARGVIASPLRANRQNAGAWHERARAARDALNAARHRGRLFADSYADTVKFFSAPIYPNASIEPGMNALAGAGRFVHLRVIAQAFNNSANDLRRLEQLLETRRNELRRAWAPVISHSMIAEFPNLQAEGAKLNELAALIQRLQTKVFEAAQ